MMSSEIPVEYIHLRTDAVLKDVAPEDQHNVNQIIQILMGMAQHRRPLVPEDSPETRAAHALDATLKYIVVPHLDAATPYYDIIALYHLDLQAGFVDWSKIVASDVLFIEPEHCIGPVYDPKYKMLNVRVRINARPHRRFSKAAVYYFENPPVYHLSNGTPTVVPPGGIGLKRKLDGADFGDTPAGTPAKRVGLTFKS